VPAEQNELHWQFHHQSFEGVGIQQKINNEEGFEKMVPCWSERDAREVIAGTILEEMVHTLQHCRSVLSLHQRPLTCAAYANHHLLTLLAPLPIHSHILKHSLESTLYHDKCKN
jgi:hypothetical protein